MNARIHPTAVVAPDAEIDDETQVGPFAVIGPKVAISEGVYIAPHVVIECNTKIGPGCTVGVGSVLGGAPQDRSYQDEETWLEIGAGTLIREYATLNRGSAATGVTTVGQGCFIMSYAHVAHDCVLEDDVTIANGVQLAGHVRVGHDATLGGLTPVHQFVRIGAYAFVGGGSRVPQDVPPYARAAGNPIKLYGLNTVGLCRAGFSRERRLRLKHAFRLLFNSNLTTAEAVDRLKLEAAGEPEIDELIAFVTRSERGVLV